MDAKCSNCVSTTHALHKTNEKSAMTHQSSLVTVRSHLRKKRGRGRKTNKRKCASGKPFLPMDIASFKEITRMERADNKMLRASKLSSIAKIASKKKTSQLWNGFWKNAIRMESQKHRNVLAESKEAMLKKKPNSEETQEDMDNVPISKSLHHPLEETQEEDDGDVPISKLLHHPFEETQEEDAGNVPISKLLHHHPSMIK